MSKPLINPTFKMLKGKDVDKSEGYKEYRRMWEENPKNHTVREFPIHLDLESTSACNLKCFMCFQSFNPPKPGYMDFGLFKKCIDEGVEKGLCSIKLQYRGEPLMHPKLVEMVKYAKDRGVLEVMFNTNATLLDENKARGLIDAGLDKIICSIDGCTKEVYEKVRIGAKFETVLENIKRLQELKKEAGVKKPVVRVQMVDTPKNHHQIKEYLEFWGKIVEHVAVEKMNDYHEKENVEICPSKDFECSQLWQRLFVLWNGDITLCCGDLYSKLILGNVWRDSISKIWTSDKLNHFRTLHTSGQSHKMQICAECDFRTNVIKMHNLG